MTLDPQIVTYAALAMAIGWTMTFSGLKKHALELRRREWDLPVLRPSHQRPGLPRALIRPRRVSIRSCGRSPRKTPEGGGFADAVSSTRASAVHARSHPSARRA